MPQPDSSATTKPHTPSKLPPEHIGNPPSAPITRRVLAIDVLRGAAILGILPMNMQLFAMIDGGFLNPYAGPWTDNLNVAVWVFLHVVIGHKDLAVFSMLFGAGILIGDARCSATGRNAAALHYRRMGVLAAFGVSHAYLIWSGDILFTYATCGLVVYLLRNIRAAWLIALTGFNISCKAFTTIMVTTTMITDITIFLFVENFGFIQISGRTNGPAIRKPMINVDVLEYHLGLNNFGFSSERIV